MKNLLTILILTLLSSCKPTDEKTDNKDGKIKLESVSENESVKKEYIPIVNSDMELQENLKKAIYEGDMHAYDLACKQYIINARYKEFLYYAILMAEKNNYSRAYKDISTILDFETQDPLVVKYNFTSQFGTYSLLKAYETGDSGAKVSVDYIYKEKGRSIPTSNSIYCPK